MQNSFLLPIEKCNDYCHKYSYPESQTVDDMSKIDAETSSA